MTPIRYNAGKSRKKGQYCTMGELKNFLRINTFHFLFRQYSLHNFLFERGESVKVFWKPTLLNPMSLTVFWSYCLVPNKHK